MVDRWSRLPPIGNYHACSFFHPLVVVPWPLYKEKRRTSFLLNLQSTRQFARLIRGCRAVQELWGWFQGSSKVVGLFGSCRAVFRTAQRLDGSLGAVGLLAGQFEGCRAVQEL